MKIKHLLVLFVALLTFCVKSQEINPETWQKEHPEVSIIESEDLKNFTNDELNILNGNFIIIFDHLTLADIQNFENSKIKSGNIKPEEILSPKEEQLIKDWLSSNNSVKIITNSEFMNSEENIQNEYIKSKCLILKGENLTFEDILNYE